MSFCAPTREVSSRLQSRLLDLGPLSETPDRAIVRGVVEQPTGTVTLLFTDIEGSTRLLARLGTERYAKALDLHRKLLREAFDRHRGYEVNCEGDSFFVTFASAQDAIAAAAAAQRALAAAEWPDEAAIRVRIGVHTGEPRPEPPKYVGLDVHKTARIMSAGHGGQVLISDATRRLVPDATAVSLGEHGLKDLLQPEPLYQLAITGLRSSFPPLLTLGNRPTNLPVQASAIIGRERELAELCELLLDEHPRLITVTGVGGAGKTRLALHAAANVVEHFESGVFAVFLAPLRDPELLLTAIAETFSLQEVAGQTLEETLTSYLSTKKLLLVLDNLEHLQSSVLVLGRLLSACSGLSILATSRVRLRLQGETLYELPPLEDADAIGLLRERVHALDVSNVDDDQLALVARQLEGLPLALELAAPLLRTFPAEDLLGRLERRLGALVGGPHDADERQQTMRNTIQWSYDLLGDDAQTLFAQCSVFVGGADLDAVERVTEIGTSGLPELVEASLLRIVDRRLEILEAIREFAAERMLDSDGDLPIRLRHADYYAAVAAAADRRLREEDESAFATFDAERENIRAALLTLREHRPDKLLALAAACGWHWYIRGHLTEGRRWLDAALDEHLATAEPETVALALMRRAAITEMQGELYGAETDLRKAIDIRRALNDQGGVAAALNNLGSVVLHQRRDYEGARRIYSEALEIDRQSGSIVGIASGLCNLATIAHLEGNHESAMAMLAESRTLARELGNRYGEATVEQNVVEVALAQGDLLTAADSARAGLRLAGGIEAVGLRASAIENVASLALKIGDAALAAFLLGGAETIRNEHSLHRMNADDSLARTNEEAVRELGEEAFRRQKEEGALAPVEIVTAQVLDVCERARTFAQSGKLEPR
jgi:predicted ATPase/class 3 adenylate cyclase